MVGIGVGVNSVGPSAQTPGSTSTAKADRSADYLAKLAGNLSISADALKAANVTTQNQLIDEAVAAGKLTAAQGVEAKARIAQGGGLLGMMHGPGHRGGPRDGALGAMRPSGPDGGPFAPVAALLGTDQQTLMAELRTGKSLAQVAEAHGKTRDEVKAVLNAQHSAMLDKMLDQFGSRPRQRPQRPAAVPNS